MESLILPEAKTTYDKCKYKVKLWEHKFKKQYGRLPSKLDIREADKTIRDAYKMYFQLKSAALEQSFKDIDGFNSDEDEEIASNNSNVPEQEVIEAEEEIVQNTEKTWGSHLSNQTEENIPNKPSDKMKVNTSFTQKLFKNSSFSKRNPRKSLSIKSKSLSQNIEPKMFETLSQPQLTKDTDIFTFNIFNNVKIASASEQTRIQSTNMQNALDEGYKIRNVDVGWVQRLATKTDIDSQSEEMRNFVIVSRSNNDDDEDIIDSDSNDESTQLHIAKKRKLISVGVKSFGSFCQPWNANERTNVSEVRAVNEESIDVNINTLEECLNINTGCFDVNTHKEHIGSHNLHANIDKDPNDVNEERPDANEKCVGVNEERIIINVNVDINEKCSDTHKECAGNKKEHIDIMQHINMSNEHTNIVAEHVKKKLIKTDNKTRNVVQKRVKTHEEHINDSTQMKQKSKAPNKKLTKTLPPPAEERNMKRVSTRQRKTLVTLDPDSEHEDFVDSDADPDFDVNNTNNDRKANISFEFGSDNENIDKKEKTQKKKTTKRKRSTNKTEDKKELEETESYELEFSIKPRLVTVPRNSIKKTMKKTKEKKRISKKKNEEVGPTSNADLKKLEKKIASGNLNDNFVRIDLKKKIYARGKKTMNFSKYKKKMWRHKKKNNALTGENMDMGGCDGGMLTCFNCGEVGHFAQKCLAMKRTDKLLPMSGVPEDEEEPSPFPTLEEASKFAQGSHLTIRKPKQSSEVCNDDEMVVDGTSSEEDVMNDSDEELLAEALKLEEYVRKVDMDSYVDLSKVVGPVYNLSEDGKIIDTPQEVYEALQLFGHSSFRPGQEKAIMRILSGQSTLVTLSTGSGKSLCYQIPAYIYSQHERCVALIISPLVSLMEDQVTGIPAFLKAACLHTNKTKGQREKILEAISSGSLDVLLVSPEAIVAGEKLSGFGSLLRQLPPIAFACIDEAHCVSQWSHNFRPSYLMLCRILRERLGVRTILGLTATATRSTTDSIIEHLSIPDGLSGVITDTPLPDNLRLTVSKDVNKDTALLNLLLSENFNEFKSIIIYCIRRQECERVASFLRTSLGTMRPKDDDDVIETESKKTTTTTKKKKKVNMQAEPYHAGLSAARRKKIQKDFMDSSLRIVVATVAFGMGINKSDIRAVIHYNLPKSFESYVQEVGRAGRDGLPAHCHLFLDPRGNDISELQKHVYSDSADRHVIRKLLQKVFIPCSCKGVCPKHEVAFSIEQTVRQLDIPEENISTLLCYLELHNERYIELLSPAYTMCKVIAYGGGRLTVRKAAKDCPPLMMALAMFSSEDDKDGVFEFPIVEVASNIGWDSGMCKHKLKNLEWITVNGQSKRSQISIQFTDLGFRLLAPGNVSDDHLDNALDSLYNRVSEQEKTSLLQIQALYKTVAEAAVSSYRVITEEIDKKEVTLKTKVREYFNDPSPLSNIKLEEHITDEGRIANDVRTIVAMYRDNTFNGKTIARIFYGIQSPNYPAVMWGRCKFWRAHMNSDFNAISKIATRELIKMRV